MTEVLRLSCGTILGYIPIPYSLDNGHLEEQPANTLKIDKSFWIL